MGDLTDLYARLEPLIIGTIRRIIPITKGSSGSTCTADTLFMIMLYNLSTLKVDVYAPTGAGLAEAITALEAGDIIWLPAGTFDDNHTIPANTELVGLGVMQSYLSGTITNNGTVSNVKIHDFTNNAFAHNVLDNNDYPWSPGGG